MQTARWMVTRFAISLLPLMLFDPLVVQGQSYSPSLPSNHLRSSVLVLYDSTEEYGMACYEQTVIALRTARIPYRSFNLGPTNILPPLQNYASVLITTETVWKLTPEACAQLTQYVREGGGAAVLFRGWNEGLQELFGIRFTTAPNVIATKSRGLVFTKEFLPGFRNLTLNDQLIPDVSRFDVELDSSAIVFATTAVGSYPVAWFERFGAGRIVYWNTSLLSTKVYRGLISASMGCIQPWTSVMLMNFSTVCLDDFPLPSPNVQVEPLKTEFHQTPSEFYALRWFPDMMKLAQRYDLKYTSGLIFSYSEMTTPPYIYLEWTRSEMVVGGKPINSSVWVAREASREIELGLHGHNHEPLTLGIWKTEGNMELALQAARRRWEVDNLGPLPSSYIPPMNVIDSTGIRALAASFPSVKVVGGQFMGKYELGQGREFGPEPWDHELTDVPRTTSGYIMDDFSRIATVSMVHALGVWNHFVHPDDVINAAARYQESVRDFQSVDVTGWYDEPARDGLYYRFQAWLDFIQATYPWLRRVTLNESREIVQQFAAASVTVESAGRLVRFSSASVPSFYLFYLPPENRVVSIKGGHLLSQRILAFSKYIVVQANAPSMELKLANPVDSIRFEAPPQRNLYPSAGLERNDLAIPARETIALSPAKPRRGSASSQPERPTENPVSPIARDERLVARDPGNVTLWRALAGEYRRDNDEHGTIRALENVVRLSPEDLDSRRELARQLVESNRVSDAIPVYKEIVNRAPRDTAALRSLAQLYVWTERQKDAIATYQKLLVHEPKNIGLHRTVGELCFWNSMFDEGIRQYEQVVALSKRDTASMRLLAQKYLEVNRQQDAIRMYEQILPFESRDVAFRKQLAQLYAWNNAPAKAVGQYEAMAGIEPGNREIQATLAEMYLANGEQDKAIGQFEKLLRGSRNDIASLKHLGELYLWKERQKDAVGIYEQIVAAEPDSIPSRMMLGRLYLWTQRPREAADEFREVVRRDSGNKEALDLLAEVERGDGEWSEARGHYRAALALDANDRTAISGLEEIDREHSQLGKSSYEYGEDSNKLIREQVPFAAGVFQFEDWDVGVNGIRQNISDHRLGGSETGYGLGIAVKTAVSRTWSLTGSVLGTSYASGWTPLSASIQAEGALLPGLSSSVRARRFETTEGVQAINTRIMVNQAAADAYWQATERFSLSGTAEGDSYSDDNTKETFAAFSTLKVISADPGLMLLGNYAYQDSKIIYPSSTPYWTPSKLSTSSVGVDFLEDVSAWLRVEAAYLSALQAGVFSNNVRLTVTLKPSRMTEISFGYEKLGSAVYNQETMRVVAQIRY